MTRLLLSASLCLLIATSMDAQQDPQFTQWFMEPASFNPAVAGNSELTCISGTYRNQWVGLDGDPNTSMLTAHTFVDQLQGGVLLSFYNDALGQEENTMARLGYAYHMEPLSNGAIVSAGLSASMFTKKLGNEWISIDPWQDDSAIPNNESSSSAIDIDLGILFASLAPSTQEFQRLISSSKNCHLLEFNPVVISTQWEVTRIRWTVIICFCEQTFLPRQT